MQHLERMFVLVSSISECITHVSHLSSESLQLKHDINKLESEYKENITLWEESLIEYALENGNKTCWKGSNESIRRLDRESAILNNAEFTEYRNKINNMTDKLFSIDKELIGYKSNMKQYEFEFKYLQNEIDIYKLKKGFENE